MTDLQIIEEVKKGNEACLSNLYKFLPDVRRFMLQNSGSEDDAKDYLQDAIVVFYKNILSGKYAHNNLKGYILTIVRNKWFDWLDKLKGPKKDPGVKADEWEDPKPIDIKKPAVSLSDYLEGALNKIGQRCKEVIIATVYMELSMEQAAASLDFPTAHAVRQKKLTCLKSLRELIPYEDIINLF